MYGKLFVQMYDGTLATRGPWQALITFQQFIILSDRTGMVDMTAESISRRTTIPLDIIKIGITALEQPDSESRTPDLEGRRIVRLSELREWGWRIVNYEHYRGVRSQEERREYMRNYQRKRRAEDVNNPVNNVNNVSEFNQSSKQEAVSSKHLDSEPLESVRPKLAQARPKKKINGEHRATRITSDWWLPDDWKQWAVDAHHLDPQRVVRISLGFRDYWVAVPGSKGCKLDWQATWRNWVRKECGDA